MCWIKSQNVRWMMVIANFSLFAGLAVRNLSQHWMPHRDWVDGIFGLMLGVSIGLNLMALRLKKRGAAATVRL
jgi:hypothetical protein